MMRNGKPCRLFLFSVLAALALLFVSGAVNADSLYVEDYARLVPATYNHTFNLGNWTQNYTLMARINVSGSAVTHAYVTFYVPYGFENATPCNHSTLGFTSFNNSVMKCVMNLTTVAANDTNISIKIKANVSAYSDANTTDPKTFKFFWIEASGASVGALNASPVGHYATNYYINPRPFVNPLATALAYANNHTFFITNWNSTDAYYRAMLPLESYNETLGYPQPRNNTFGELMFMNGMGPERPTFMRMSGFNLTVEFRNLTSTDGTSDYYYYIVRTPVNATLHPAQTLMPLLIYNQTITDPFDNSTFNMTMGTPAQNGFSVWIGGTRYTDSQLGSMGIDMTFSIQNQDTSGFLIINATNSSLINNTQMTVLFTLMNFTCVGEQCSGGMATPLYVNWQSFDKDSQRPQFGANLSFNYFGNYSNVLNNYTLQNLSLTYFLPKNVTIINNTDGSNMTFNISNGTGMYWYDNGNSNWTYRTVTNRANCTNVTDNMPGSPVYGQSIYVCFLVYDLQLYQAAFSSWTPNATTSNVTVKVNGTMSFPTFGEETNFTAAPPSAGQSQSYEVAFSSSGRSAFDLSEKVPSIDANTNPNHLTITVDGQTYTYGQNYSLGSLYFSDLTSGSHSVSITYAVPAETPRGTGGGSTPTPCATPTATPTPTVAPRSTYAPTSTPRVTPGEETPAAPAEQPTGTPPAGDTGVVSEARARASVSTVQESLALAKRQGVNAPEAERLLALAQQALNEGRYAQALENARLAQNALDAAKALAAAAEAKRGVAGGVDWKLVIAIIIVVLVAAGYLYYARSKKRGL
jgi:hypothetical protein